MKIIKIGEIPKKNPIQHTCFNCQTIFEFMEDEIDINGKIMCPLCNVMCTIKYIPFSKTIPRIKRDGPCRPWHYPDYDWVSPYQDPPKRYTIWCKQ